MRPLDLNTPLRILGIDPGLNQTGVAWSYGDAPPKVFHVRPKSKDLREKGREIAKEIPDMCWDLIVIERPQVYRQAKQKGDPNDLISLAILVGSIVSFVSSYDLLLVLPTTWKGSEPKLIAHRRYLARAPSIKDPSALSLDALDALGLLQYGQDYVAAKIKAQQLKRSL